VSSYGRFSDGAPIETMVLGGGDGKREARAGAGAAKTNGNGKDGQEKQGGLKGDERGEGRGEKNRSIASIVVSHSYLIL
jgi:hypothetical protein